MSDLAMIGIYYFKEGERLKKELEYLIEHNVIKGGEYQLPDALRRMTEEGCVFKPGEVNEWMDCGNKEVTVHTNQRVLEHDWAGHKALVHPSVKVNEAIIIPPCFIGENVILSHSIVGPHVSIGAGTHIANSIVKNSIIQHSTAISNSILQDSMIGSNVVIKGSKKDLSIGDFSTYHA